jgi:hypothetical protein
MQNYDYFTDTELPAPSGDVREDGALVDLSTGWTLSAKVCPTSTPAAALINKTSGVTGYATSPSWIVDWSTSDFAALTASASGSKYIVTVFGRRSSDSKDEPLGQFQITMYPAITGP